jgi:hypothetical protein
MTRKGRAYRSRALPKTMEWRPCVNLRSAFLNQLISAARCEFYGVALLSACLSESARVSAPLGLLRAMRLVQARIGSHHF